MKTTEKSRLIDEIEASLANRNCPLWFPELSPKLARAAWDSLRRDVGLTPHSYGTARVLAHDPTAPRTVFARLPVPRPSNGPGPNLLVEWLDGSAARRYEELGLDFATADEIANTHALDCIQEAMSILARVPSLRDTLFQLVKVIHILRAQGDEYDVSHSDPAVPFSVFVSVPNNNIPNVGLRVMESIVHEAMHLELTLIETALCLVRETNTLLTSPWRTELRPPSGVLHGIYVFTIIARAYGLLLATRNSSSVEANFFRQRLGGIARETEAAFLSVSSDVLTSPGQKLLARLKRLQLEITGI